MRRSRAGQSVRQMAARRRRHRMKLALTMLVLGLALVLLIAYLPSAGVGALGILAVAIAAQAALKLMDIKIRRVRRAERRALRGARGEEQVGALLDRLDRRRFFVLHDLPSPFGNIDHLVITHSGAVFLLETKAHGGRVSVRNERLLVNGRPPEKDFIAQALKNALWIRKRLGQLVGVEPWVTPVVVFANASVDDAPPVRGVHVVSLHKLETLLQQRGRTPQVWAHRDAVPQALRAPAGHSR